jgi:hypothetical protein
VRAFPVLSVVAVLGLSVPQVPDEVNRTESPWTGPPVAVVTVAVSAEVVAPSAGTLAGLADTAIAAGGPPPVGDVCVIVTVPVPPVAPSLAVIVQNPGVAEEM